MDVDDTGLHRVAHRAVRKAEHHWSDRLRTTGLAVAFGTDRAAYIDAFFANLDFSVVDGWVEAYAIRSDVNRSIWRLFKENGITIPVAQREIVVRMREADGLSPPPSP